MYALLTFASGKRPTVGSKIFTGTPVLDAKTGETSLVIGDVIGVIQARNLINATTADILFTTTNREKFTTGATIAIEEESTGFFTAQ